MTSESERPESEISSWAELLSSASRQPVSSAEPAEQVPPRPGFPPPRVASPEPSPQDRHRRLEDRLLAELAEESSDALTVCVVTNCLSVVYFQLDDPVRASSFFCRSARVWRELEGDPSEAAAARLEQLLLLFLEESLEVEICALEGCIRRLRSGPPAEMPLLDPWRDLPRPHTGSDAFKRAVRRSEIWEKLRRFRLKYWILPGWFIPRIPVVIAVLCLLAGLDWYRRQVYLDYYYETCRTAHRSVLSKPDEAERLMRRLLQENPRVAEPHLYLAAAALASEEAELARSHAKDALEIRPGCPEAHYYLGLADFAEGHPEAGFQGLQTCQELLGPGYPEEPNRVDAWRLQLERAAEWAGSGAAAVPAHLIRPCPDTVPAPGELRTRSLSFWHYVGWDQ
ncbi:MAG: hypothetical protein HY319_15535 [Armatimonadetes bacterium]|nr:hypothetical protein [Armatimonadota bacterium]